jgi:hypothetical protein
MNWIKVPNTQFIRILEKCLDRVSNQGSIGYTSERLTLSPTYLYQHERALPENPHSQKCAPPPLNVVSETTPPPTFSYLSLVAAALLQTSKLTCLDGVTASVTSHWTCLEGWQQAWRPTEHASTGWQQAWRLTEHASRGDSKRDVSLYVPRGVTASVTSHWTCLDGVTASVTSHWTCIEGWQ